MEIKERNPKGIKSFSPALADEIGLRRVTGEKGFNPVGVEYILVT
jgi:hypothetical protein